MQQNYFVYVHEKDRYDFYMLQDVLRPASPYFMIDFEDVTALFRFLHTLQDELYPKLIVIDLYDELQVQTIISKLRLLHKLSVVPVWLLADTLPEKIHENGMFLARPQHREAWAALAHRIVQHLATR